METLLSWVLSNQQNQKQARRNQAFCGGNVLSNQQTRRRARRNQAFWERVLGAGLNTATPTLLLWVCTRVFWILQSICRRSLSAPDSQSLSPAASSLHSSKRAASGWCDSDMREVNGTAHCHTPCTGTRVQCSEARCVSTVRSLGRFWMVVLLETQWTGKTLWIW